MSIEEYAYAEWLNEGWDMAKAARELKSTEETRTEISTALEQRVIDLSSDKCALKNLIARRADVIECIKEYYAHLDTEKGLGISQKNYKELKNNIKWKSQDVLVLTDEILSTKIRRDHNLKLAMEDIEETVSARMAEGKQV